MRGSHQVWFGRFVLFASAVVTGTAAAQESTPVPDTQKVQFHLAQQPVGQALTALGQQSGLTVVVESSLARDVMAPAVDGNYTPAEALRRILAPTGLHARYLDKKTVAVVAAKSDSDAPTKKINRAESTPAERQKTNSDSAPASSNDQPTGADPSSQNDNASESTSSQSRSIPEILVRGSKILNTDIARTRDDAQPYVIFDRAAIESSGATNLDSFLKQRLPMDTSSASFTQQQSPFIGQSDINLRGLGSNQTLILVDGRRLPGVSLGGTPAQPDINGIPLVAVERIEILPTTASGIYGGSATGGVINIIMRHDYEGAQLTAKYGNSFDAGSSNRSIDLNAGKQLEGGRSSVSIVGSWSNDGELLAGDRDFLRRGRANILANNPQAILSADPPPLGATTNIRSTDGSPLFGPGTASFTSVPTGYAGGGGLDPFLANAGRYNLDIPDTVQMGGRQTALVGAVERKSLSATVRREFTPSITAFIDAAGSNTRGHTPLSAFDYPLTTGFTIPAEAPNNPFGQSIDVTVPSNAGSGRVEAESKQLRFAVGATAKLPRDWSAEADYTWSRWDYIGRSLQSDFINLPTALADGTVDVLRDTLASPLNLDPYVVQTATSTLRSTTKNASLRVAGPIGTLPGGKPTVTILLEHRDDQYGDGTGTEYQNAGLGTPLLPLDVLLQRSQRVTSGYLELNAPLVSEANRLPAVEELAVQVAVRHDSYHTSTGPTRVDIGSTTPIVRTDSSLGSTDPTTGLRWRPIRYLMFRASYGTGFLPPSPDQLASPPTPYTIGAGFSGVTDPRRGNSPLGAYQIQGGPNPNLQPEESKSFSAGAVITPRALNGLRLSLDYTQIHKTNNIAFISAQQLLDNEASFPSRVTRGPVPAGDPYGVGPVTALNVTLINAAKTDVEAYDAQLDYHWETFSHGTFDFFAIATRQMHFKQQLVPTAPVLEQVGITSAFPLKFKANAGLTWTYRTWTLGWYGRFYDSYVVSTDPLVIQNQGSTRVPSQNYHDLFVRYHFAKGVKVLENTEVQFGVTDVFNTKPPFDANNSAIGFYSPYGDPRLASYYLSLRAGF